MRPLDGKWGGDASIRAETGRKAARNGRDFLHLEMQRRAHGEIKPDELLISDSLGATGGESLLHERPELALCLVGRPGGVERRRLDRRVAEHGLHDIEARAVSERMSPEGVAQPVRRGPLERLAVLAALPGVQGPRERIEPRAQHPVERAGRDRAAGRGHAERRQERSVGRALVPALQAAGGEVLVEQRLELGRHGDIAHLGALAQHAQRDLAP